MERIDSILAHPIFQEQYELLLEAEKDRIFCRHTMEHFMDVARLMYIFCLEAGTPYKKDVVYAAAMLHDIGRYEQMTKGTPHHIAGARIGREILSDCGFSESEILEITDAILDHRNKKPESRKNAKASIAGRLISEASKSEALESEKRNAETVKTGEKDMDAGEKDTDTGNPGLLKTYLYRADKMSRSCFSCSACKECNWPDEKKNMRIQY
ncbi:MAG: HD domain-containing protein [Lachnospiraceae bacterium]|nr:HD domain-containing protein [Lachnospiraceae bacterium]